MAASANGIVPGLAHAFDMVVERADPIEVGLSGLGGKRSHVPVKGGTFAGEGMIGRLVGGGETLLERADGVAMIEATYYIVSAAGWVAQCFGRGYRTSGGDFAGTRMTLLFEADESGPLAHLTMAAFVAEQLPGSPLLSISRIT